MQRLSGLFGASRQILLHADASAALALTENSGLGKARHVDTNVLWLQQKRLRDEPQFEKVKGSENPSDLQTKHFDWTMPDTYLGIVNFKRCEARAHRATGLRNLKECGGRNRWIT